MLRNIKLFDDISKEVCHTFGSFFVGSYNFISFNKCYFLTWNNLFDNIESTSFPQLVIVANISLIQAIKNDFLLFERVRHIDFFA